MTQKSSQKFSLNPRLLVAVSAAAVTLLLAGCKDEKVSFFDWLQSLGEPTEEQIIEQAQIIAADPAVPYPIKTVSGSYLAGRFAQNTFDWDKAYDYLSGISALENSNIDLRRRAMVLAMGSGHYSEAFAMAREVIKSGETGSLPKFFIVLETFKNGQYESVIKDTEGMPQDGISEFINPLVKAWAKAGLGQIDTTGLTGNVVHIYHAILIADYLKNQDAIKSLAARDLTQFNLSTKSLEHIADIYARNGQPQAAQKLYTFIRNNDPEDAQDIAEKEDKLEEQTAVSKEPPATIKTPAEGLAQALFDMASVLYGEYEDSAQLFAQMSLYLNPAEADARILLGHMASRYERFDDAIDQYQQIDATQDQALKIKIDRQIAELLSADGKTDEAIDVLKGIVAKTNDVDAQIQVGDLYRKDEKYAEALTEYNKAYTLLNNQVPQKYWHLIYARGMTNERLKNWEQAEKDLVSALAYEPDHPYILNYLGYSWADQGTNLEKAAEMIARAARLRPNDGYIVDSLGWVYYRMGKYKEAVTTLEAAVELMPYDPTINDHLGDAYWQVGRKAEARFQWQRAASFSKDQKELATIEGKLKNGLQTSDAATPASAEKQAQREKPETLTTP